MNEEISRTTSMPSGPHLTGRASAGILLASGAALGATGALALDGNRPDHAFVAPAVARVGTGQPHALATMVQTVSPSVAQIEAVKRVGGNRMAPPFGDDDAQGGDDPMRHFSGRNGGRMPQQPASREQGALGSGFVIDRSGPVFTTTSATARAR